MCGICGIAATADGFAAGEDLVVAMRDTMRHRGPDDGGSWTSPDGHTEQDDVVMVEIVTDTFDRAWWRAYADTLAARFDQESIHVRAVPVDMLDEEQQ